MKPFDLTWLTRQLAMGGRLPPDAAARLVSEHGIRRVIDLRAEEQDDASLLRAHGVELLLLPVPDVQPVPREMLDSGVSWSMDAFERDQRVLIHCEHGIGRSALLSLCVLVARGHSPLGALKLAKSARVCVSPSPAQLEALMSWSATWCERTGRRHERSNFEEFAKIAYSHLQDIAGPSA